METKKIFEELIIDENVVKHFLSKSKDEIKDIFGYEVAEMVGYDQQNPYHCYDLFEHTLRTVEGISKEGLTDTEYRNLKVAAFFHDIGKPEVEIYNEERKRKSFYGHPANSLKIAKPILKELGYSEKEIEKIGFLISHHDDFMNYKTNSYDTTNHKHIRKIEKNTIMEKLIENKFNFKAMIYNKDEILSITYFLVNGEMPNFKLKPDETMPEIDMEEVKEKIRSGEYNSKYDPSLEDYMMLLKICRADSNAQSDIAKSILPDGTPVIESRKEDRLADVTKIEELLPEAYAEMEKKVNEIKEKVKKEIEYHLEDFIKETKCRFRRPVAIMEDGTEMSIQASSFHYCEPPVSGLDKYDSVEIGFPSVIIDELRPFVECPVQDDEELLESVYPYVPIEIASQIVDKHGGINREKTLGVKSKLENLKNEKSDIENKNEQAEELICKLMTEIGKLFIK